MADERQGESVIAFEDISFSYGERRVFEDFSLSLPGKVTVLEGASGSGKTTLMKIAAGLLRPEKGKVSGVPEKVSFMFQENRLLPWFSARENVAAVLPKSRRGEAVTWLKLMELEDFLESLPGNMSGGQQRRVAIARALAYGGELLIMDEPLKGLDEALQQRVTKRILELKRRILVTSHSEFESCLWGGERVTIEPYHHSEMGQ